MPLFRHRPPPPCKSSCRGASALARGRRHPPACSASAQSGAEDSAVAAQNVVWRVLVDGFVTCYCAGRLCARSDVEVACAWHDM
eukprot:4239467-Prymnesium_polylepis.2